MKNFLLNRIKEPSTWRGLALCSTAFGMAISPEQADAIATLGLALTGGMGALTPDKVK